MSTRSTPLVSVVTPVYNTDKYLAECIESVLAQTYERFEYVIVDNRSTDGSAAIAERFAARDQRVRVHTNAAFLSQMENWNHALGLISPDSAYCKILHADDWMFPACLEEMVRIGEDHPSTGLIGSYRLDETEPNLGGLPYPSPVTPGRDVARMYFLEGTYLMGAPSNLLIRSEVVRGRTPFYDEGKLHADVDAALDVLRSWDFGFVHQVLTFTRRHNESTSSRVARLATKRVWRLEALMSYGSDFLTREEYAARKRELEWNYYRFLAQQALELRESEFWRFHRDELRDMGERFRYPYLAFALAVEALDLKGSAKRVATGVRRRLGARSAGSGTIAMDVFRKERGSEDGT